MPGKPATVDAYLARLPDDQRVALEALRATIKAAAPKAEECLSYGVCAFRQSGILVGFGATRTHCAFYLFSGSIVAEHESALAGYDTSKGTVRFQPSKPLPKGLVRTLVKARLAENAKG